MIRRWLRRRFGVDRWFFFKCRMKSKLSRVRCLVMGGHTHEWKQCFGGGYGQDALICTRCCCHIKEFRATQPETKVEGA